MERISAKLKGNDDTFLDIWQPQMDYSTWNGPWGKGQLEVDGPNLSYNTEEEKGGGRGREEREEKKTRKMQNT